MLDVDKLKSQESLTGQKMTCRKHGGLLTLRSCPEPLLSRLLTPALTKVEEEMYASLSVQSEEGPSDCSAQRFRCCSIKKNEGMHALPFVTN